MSCCCNKIYSFCNAVNACTNEGLSDMFKDLIDGQYKMELDFAQGKQLITVTVATPDLTFSGASLNESYEYTGKLFDSEGAPVALTFDGIEYDCFQFNTKIFI